MYCPNCGNKNSREQKFCRSCGLSLEKIAQSLTEQIPTTVERSLAERKERLERFGVAALCVFVLPVLGYILYSAFTKLMVSQGPLLAALILLGAVVIVGCGLLSAILFAKANELKETPAPRDLEEPEIPETGKLFDAHHSPAFRITDRTTDLLTVESARKTVNDQ
jgi:hypothetical protein